MEELIMALKEQTAAINALVQSNAQLIMVLAEGAMDEGGEDRTVKVYMDGSPCR